MAHSLKSVRRLLKDKPTLKILELEISAQKALLAEVRRLLPDDLAEHCLAARLRERQLILHTDSPVWATRLRFFATNLISLLQPDYSTVTEIRIKPLIKRSEPAVPAHPPRHSDVGAAIVADSALDTAHPPLREALERLSRTLRRKR
jgi:hypothetical protein